MEPNIILKMEHSNHKNKEKFLESLSSDALLQFHNKLFPNNPDWLIYTETFLREHMKDLNNMYQIKRHEKSRRIIYKIGVLNEKRCK